MTLLFLFRPLQFRGFLPLPPYLCAKFRDGYDFKTNEILCCSDFQLIFTSLFLYLLLHKVAMAKMRDEKKKSFNAQEVIFGHILDGHEFHFFDIINSDGTHKPVGIPLPVILYSPQKGFDVFMSSKFHHGHEDHDGYRLLTEEGLKKLEEKGIEVKKEGLSVGKIIAVGANGKLINQ